MRPRGSALSSSACQTPAGSRKGWSARPALISSRNDYRIAIDELRAVLGYQNNFASDLKKVPDFSGELVFSPVAYDLEAALAAAKARRPELLRLEQIRQAGLKAVPMTVAAR